SSRRRHTTFSRDWSSDVCSSDLTNGDAILSRNPFDSVTGPLDRTPLEVTVPEPAKASLDLTDPLSAPECADVVVNIVSESPDPRSEERRVGKEYSLGFWLVC